MRKNALKPRQVLLLAVASLAVVAATARADAVTHAPPQKAPIVAPAWPTAAAAPVAAAATRP